MKYAPARSLAPSGEVWLGDVPANWDVCAIAYRYEVALGKMLDEKRVTGDALGPYLRNVDVQWGRINTDDLPTMDFIGGDLERYALRAGDLLVCEGGDVGRSAIWAAPIEPCFYQKALHRLRPRDQSRDLPQFMQYCLRAAADRGVFTGAEGKSTIAHLTAEALRRYRFPFPPAREQAEIAAFLDRETDKIDALVEEQRRLIDLLKEKRQAVISHAVTKGLNPNAKMKPSGVVWLGDVPAHWTVLSIRRITAEHRQGYYSTEGYVDEGTPLLRITDLRGDGGVDYADCPRVSRTSGLEAFLLREDDFVFARTGGAGTFGWIRHLSEPTAYASYLIRFRFFRDASPDYMRFFLEAVNFQAALGQFIHGGVNQNVHAEDIKNQVIALPPLAEQHQIAAKLAKETAAIADLMEAAPNGIALLQERRNALISAAVTGKIDVREVSAADEVAA